MQVGYIREQVTMVTRRLYNVELDYLSRKQMLK